MISGEIVSPIRLQQDIILHGENLSPTRLILQYMKEFSKSDKLKAFIATNITYIITFLDNNVKSAVYIWVKIHGIYYCLEIIGYPTTLTTSGQLSHNFVP